MCVRGILVRRLQRLHFGRAQLHPGEDENCSSQHAGNCAQRIERLSKIQSPLGGFRIAAQCNKGIRSGFQKRKSTGQDEKRGEKEPIPANHRGRPEKKCSRAE